MNEEEVISRTSAPVTVETLVRDLSALGVTAGTTVLVHSSLSSLGWVSGGAPAVVLAIEEVIRPYGTLVMPTHSADLSDPSGWENPPVPESWWEEIRRSMPAFDPEFTPTRGMGRIPECFRNQKEVFRSDHPQFSFAAWGDRSIELLSEHNLDFGLGEHSPLARIYDADGWVLLLGVGHDSNTSLHLSEHRADYPSKKLIPCSSPVLIEGHRRWKGFSEINYDSSDFTEIGREFETRHAQAVRLGYVGLAESRLFPQRICVDFGAAWMERRRRTPA
jgi:aminoglycoside 3-N-acetyltransferase